MIKTVSYAGLKFQQVSPRNQLDPRNQETYYIVSADNHKYIYKVKSFSAATLWINEMADNNDIAAEMMNRICKKFNCDVHGNSYMEVE